MANGFISLILDLSGLFLVVHNVFIGLNLAVSDVVVCTKLSCLSSSLLFIYYI